ncbi:MAG: hypothetical protein ACKOWO_00545 [Sediminibacterium sp.]
MKLFFNKKLILKSLIAFLFAGIFVSCTKEEVASDIDFQRHLVGGTGSFQNTFKIWKLDSMAVDGKAVILTTNQKKYTKKFYHSGAYIDSDGFSGTWEIAELNALSHVTTGAIATTKLTSKYEIVEVNSAQLNVKLLNTTNKYEYFFIISN